ncbi:MULTISPECIES: NB-ARC domain-containing protein [Planktothrix]|uniref:NB-ARC domain-containing protein n=1 Tax=Planktothrix TaxID=54304 RepID=UPI0004163119|nr:MULTISPECIES: NB-ARC domain-containing protein [Planktothrix]CAD0232022.1 WD-repeat protein [Planktothrix agardhii]CAD5968651.1 putative WD repeat-containing protein alr2800 [Planktothrix agardhii]
MDVQTILKWADELMFIKTGTHLNSLQQAVLTGVWHNQKYGEIAERYHCSEANVKRVASNLWEIISEELGEKVNKSNFRATMERYNISNSQVGNFVVQSQSFGSSITVCGENRHSQETTKNRSSSPVNSDNNQTEKYHDITEVSECEVFCNRTQELNSLKQLILTENSRIITIFGLSGIGKTALATQLVKHIKDDFDRVIWRSHSQFSSLKSLQTNLIEFLSQQQETQELSIIDSLRSHRCLIILDDFQETLTSGELVGSYLPEYKNYGKLLKQIGRSPHNSCLLLLSWEKPIEIATLEAENSHCRSLELRGLGESGEQLLKARGLNDQDQWLELINLYGGNPSWLNIIALTILDLFNGNVAQFLSYSTLFLGDLETILQEHYQRLSESEKLVMVWLANQETAADICSKPAEFLSDSEFLKAVQSLRKRGLIEKAIDKEALVFTLQPVIKEYVKKQSQC